MRVLVADDDEGVLMALELLLRRADMGTARARSPAQVLEQLSGAASFDAVLLDLNYERDTTSGQEGFALLECLRREYPALKVVVMTGWASIEGAVEAMRRGAVDYVPKPWENGRLLALLRGLWPESAPAIINPSVEPASSSAAMRQLYSTVDQVAFSDVPVLITGEHGTGKELVARSIHEKSGRRGDFVALNAGALADGTFESELFGHVRGAFTDAKATRRGAFARAENGTLFLDEIANMPLAQQAKLLRVLQERLYQPLGASKLESSTARIVSATNVEIQALALDGRFRPDLLYRLNTIQLHVPPLRERLDELPGLVQAFIAREVARYGLPSIALDAAVHERLRAHLWPGNVRELEHVVQRAVLLSARQAKLTTAHLDLRATPGGVESRSAERVEPSTPAEQPLPASPPQTVRDAERSAIAQALSRFPNDRRAAAESLGLSRSAFYRRLSQYGIRPQK